MAISQRTRAQAGVKVNSRRYVATIRAVGGSVSVALPCDLLGKLGLAAGMRVEVGIEDGRIVISRIARPHFTLAELLAGMKLGDMPKDKCWAEARTRGCEAW